MLSQSPTTVQRKSNCDCCYMQQRCKKFKVHISGRSMSNYSINQACFSSAHPDANQGKSVKEACQKQESICINLIKWHTFKCHANQMRTRRQVANLVKNGERPTAGLWHLSSFLYALEEARDLGSDVKFSRVTSQ